MQSRTAQLREDLYAIVQLVKTQIKLQYESSILGVLWYFLSPLLLFGVMYFVFSGRLGADIPDYPLYLLLGIVLWNFFGIGTSHAVIAVTGNSHILLSLRVWPMMLVIASVLNILISHIIELIIIAIAVRLFGNSSITMLGIIPIVALSFLFTVGCGFLLAAGQVYCRDIQQIWAVILRVGWFATPVFYAFPAGSIGEKFSMWNPLWYMLTLGRGSMLYGQWPNPVLLETFAGFAIGLCCISAFLFYKSSPRLADLL